MNALLKQPGYLIAADGCNNSLQDYLCRHMAQAYARFRRSWAQLLPDLYLRDGGQYRLRRYSVFHWQYHKLTLQPHEPHYQSSYHNHLHGGFKRHFRPWLPTTVNNPVLPTIVAWCVRQFSTNPAQCWRIQAHQFRICTTVLEEGRPTPEGVHKDGADYILIMLLDRHNISGGVSQIYDNAMQPVAHVTLEQSGDLLLINDALVYHGVSAVTPADAQQAAWRDVLVLTFHRR